MGHREPGHRAAEDPAVFRSRSKLFGVEFITGHVRFFRACPTAGSASGLPPLKRWYVRHTTPLITRITTKATALNESGLYKILLGSNNIAQPGAANCANRAGGAAGEASMSHLVQLGRRPNPHSPPGPCYTCYMCYMALTRTSTLPRVLAICAICAISHKASH